MLISQYTLLCQLEGPLSTSTDRHNTSQDWLAHNLAKDADSTRASHASRGTRIRRACSK